MPEKEETPSDEIRLDAFLGWIWRGKWLIILLVIAASGLSAVMGMQQTETHTANALIEPGRVWSKPIRDIYVTVESANSPGFIQDVAEKAGVKAGQIARHVQVTPVESGRPRSFAPILIRVTATTETSEESVRLAQVMSDEIIARHDKMYDEALAPHLDQQHWLEAQLKSIGASPADRDAALKIRTQLDEVVSNNSSPISTARSRLIERIVPGAKARPSNLRGTVTAGLIAGIVGIVLACAVGYFKAAPRA
jgi:subunit length determinant Wzz-like protein